MSKFNKGDTVRANDKDERVQGQVGVVTCTDGDGANVQFGREDDERYMFDFELDDEALTLKGGDVVRVKDTYRGCGAYQLAGLTGVVRDNDFEWSSVLVQFDGQTSLHKGGGGFISTNNDCWYINTEYLTKVEGAGFIVINKVNGGLIPATSPFVHPTLAAAEAEAVRLAGLQSVKGEFVVFQAVRSAIVPAPSAVVVKVL